MHCFKLEYKKTYCTLLCLFWKKTILGMVLCSVFSSLSLSISFFIFMFIPSSSFSVTVFLCLSVSRPPPPPPFELLLFCLSFHTGLIWWTGFHGLTPFLAQPSLMALPHCLFSLSILTSLLLSPLMLAVGVIRNCVCSPFGLLLLRLTGLSLLALHQLHSPGSRLVAVHVGIASNVLVLCGCWWDMSQIDR